MTIIAFIHIPGRPTDIDIRIDGHGAARGAIIILYWARILIIGPKHDFVRIGRIPYVVSDVPCTAPRCCLAEGRCQRVYAGQGLPNIKVHIAIGLDARAVWLGRGDVPIVRGVRANRLRARARSPDVVVEAIGPYGEASILGRRASRRLRRCAANKGARDHRRHEPACSFHGRFPCDDYLLIIIL